MSRDVEMGSDDELLLPEATKKRKKVTFSFFVVEMSRKSLPPGSIYTKPLH